MTPSDLHTHLKRCTKAELIELLQTLALHNTAAQNFLQAKFDPTATEPDFEPYKSRVYEEFFPEHGYGDGGASVAFRILQRVEAEATQPSQVLDFLFFCVETGIQFTNSYGDINEEFYAAFEDLFERAAKLAIAINLSSQYRQRAQAIVDSTSGIGWGFHDELSDIFDKYFANEAGA